MLQRFLVFLAALSMTVGTSAGADSEEAVLTQMLNEFLAGASVNDVAAHERFWDDDLAEIDGKCCDGCGDNSDPVDFYCDSESFTLCPQCRAVSQIRDESRDAFVAGYLAAALFASQPLREEDDSDDRTFEGLGYTVDDLCATSRADARRWCADFIDANAIALIRVTEGGRFKFSSLGHDFFLSRNGHGAGFFDRVGSSDPLRPDFDALQQAARVYGSTDQCECNTDGTITIR